jgi:hypothetical protein
VCAGDGKPKQHSMEVDNAAKPSKPAEDGWDYGGAAGGADMAAEGGAADGEWPQHQKGANARTRSPGRTLTRVTRAGAPPGGASTVNGDGGASKMMGLFGAVSGCAHVAHRRRLRRQVCAPSPS